MELAFRIRRATFGGGERMQKMLISEFAKLGHNITIITWEDVKLENYSFNCNVVRLKRKRNRILQFIYELYNISKEFKSREIDCLIMFGISESFMLSSYFTNTTSLISLRVDPRFQKSQLLLKQRCSFLFLLSRGVVFQTQKIQQLFSKKIQSKSIIISNPIMDDLLPNPKLIRKHKIVSIGRLSEEKNHALLIKAFSNISAGDYSLHLYGDGPLKDELQLLISNLGMSNKIFLEGKIDNVLDEISDAEIFVMASNYEGMPNALIEAMAMGLACISTNFPSGAAEELINDYENGILIPVGSQVELENVLNNLIYDDNLKFKLMKNALEIRGVLKKDMIVVKWLDYIKEIYKRNINLHSAI